MKSLFLIALLLPMILCAQKKPVKAGDFLCVQGSDTLTVHPEDYTGGAIGVVFYVDETGQHGYAIHPQVQASWVYWADDFEPVPGLTGWLSIRESLYDLNGYENTLALRQASAYNHDLYPGAWAVDVEHGWYWPSSGQLNLLYVTLPAVNTSLSMIGGVTFEGRWVYWSSSHFGFSYDCAIYMAQHGGVGAISKGRIELNGISTSVRSIRNF